MNIKHLHLQTRHLQQQREFYLGTLGFPLHGETPQSFTIQVGASLLTFDQDDGFGGFYHVAFDIPRHQVTQARAWLQQRVPLLSDAAGEVQFEMERWNSTNLYFDDAAGNIMEFTARHDFQSDSVDEFSASSILHISELGIVVPNVLEAVQDFGERYGLHPFNGHSDTFTAVGGHDGMLIVVQRGRGWFPVGRRAVGAPFVLHFVQNGVAQRITPCKPALA